MGMEVWGENPSCQRKIGLVSEPPALGDFGDFVTKLMHFQATSVKIVPKKHLKLAHYFGLNTRTEIAFYQLFCYNR